MNKKPSAVSGQKSHVPSHARGAKTRARKRRRWGPLPGYRKRRVFYRVERLPEAVRGLIDRGLGQGKSFDRIREEVLAAGESISRNSLQNYWRNRWRQQNRRLQWINAQAQALAGALRHTGESDEAVLARKMLFAAVLNRLKKDLKGTETLDLLREARELFKVTKGPGARSSPPALPLTPEERRRRVREIYGWPEEKIEDTPEPGGSTLQG